MAEYKSKPQLLKDGIPKKPFNSGWRRNFRNWDKKFLYPDRGMLRLRSAIDHLKLPVKWKVIEFDPEWKGRFGTCVDGSYIMYTASLQLNDGRIGYIDLRPKQKGGNVKLYAIREDYCKRKQIPLLILYPHYRSDEMEYLITNWIKEKAP